MSNRSRNLSSIVEDVEDCFSELVDLKDKIDNECEVVKDLCFDYENINIKLKDLRRNIVNLTLILNKYKTQNLKIKDDNEQLESTLTDIITQLKESVDVRDKLSIEQENQNTIKNELVNSINQKNCVINNNLLHIEEYDILLRKKSKLISVILGNIENIKNEIEHNLNLYTNTIDEINKRIEIKDADIYKLKTLVEEIKNELLNNKQILNNLLNEISSLDDGISMVESSLKQLSNELLKLDSLLQSNKVKLKTLESNINDKMIKCDSIKDELVMLDTKITDIISSISDHQRHNDEIIKNINNSLKLNNDLKQKINSTNNNINKTLITINQYSDKHIKFKSKIEWIESKSYEISDKFVLIISIIKELNDHKYKQEGLLEESDRLDSEFYKLSIIENNLTHEINGIVKKIEEYTLKKKDITNNIMDKNKIYQEIVKENKLLNKELDRVNEQLTKIEDDKKESNRKIEKLKQEYEHKLKMAMEQIKNEYEEKIENNTKSLKEKSEIELREFENKLKMELNKNNNEQKLVEKRNLIANLQNEIISLKINGSPHK